MNKETMKPLSGKVAFVTGGGRGLGWAISEALAAQGADVFLTGQQEAPLRAAVARLREKGVSSGYATGDIAQTDAVDHAVARCHAELGPIDILVNNAGIAGDGAVAGCDAESWWRVMEVNVKGPLNTCRAVLPQMIAQQSGHVINIGSYQAINPAPMVSAYATSKTALLRLTDSVAAEVIDDGVIVLAISPGFVRTDLGAQAEAAMKAKVPGFDGFPDEFIFGPEAIAQMVCRVAKGEADRFHGRMLHVKDDLDALIAEADDVLAENRFALGFST